MAKSEGQEIGTARVTPDIQARHFAPPELPAAAPSIYLPHEETIPTIHSLVDQTRHFRAGITPFIFNPSAEGTVPLDAPSPPPESSGLVDTINLF